MKIIFFIGFIALCASVSGHLFRHRHHHRTDEPSETSLDLGDARHFPLPPPHHPHVHTSDCHHQPDEGKGIEIIPSVLKEVIHIYPPKNPDTNFHSNAGHLNQFNPYNPYPMGPNFGHPHLGHPPHTGWYGNEFYQHYPPTNSFYPSSQYPSPYPGMYPIPNYPGGYYPTIDTTNPPLDPTSILNNPQTQPRPDVFPPIDNGKWRNDLHLKLKLCKNIRHFFCFVLYYCFVLLGSVNNNPNWSGNTIPTNNNNNNNNGFQDNTIFTTTESSADSTDYINLIDVRFGDKTKLPSKRPNRK